MKKLLISLTLIAGLALGITVGTAGPAAAAQLPPLVYTTVQYQDCQANFRYGTYGADAFAETYPLSAGCSGLTGATVAAARPGFPTATKTCNYVDAVFLGTPGCVLLFSQSQPIGIRAVIPGGWTAFGGTAHACDDTVPFGFPLCGPFAFTAFG